MEEIFNKVDYNQENEIDIRDFVYLLDNINSFQKTGQMENTINTNLNPDEELIPIMNLNLNLNMHRKIRPKDFISLYSDLPLSFIPSFTREEQQKNNLPLSFIPSFTREEQQKNNLLPSSCLKPLTKDDITYEDIFPIESLVYGDKKEIIKDKNKAQELIHPYKKLDVFIPKISCKIYFDDYASGVSSPEETLFEMPLVFHPQKKLYSSHQILNIKSLEDYSKYHCIINFIKYLWVMPYPSIAYIKKNIKIVGTSKTVIVVIIII